MKNLLKKLNDWTSSYLKTDSKYLLAGGMWLAAGQGFSVVLSFLSAIAFANLIPKETYGVYKYILSVIAILSIPTLDGMATAVTQAVARGNQGVYLPALRTKLKWGTLGSLASMIISLYYFFTGNNTLAAAFCIAAFLIPSMEGYSLWSAVLAGKKLFKDSSMYNIATQAGISFFTILALLFTSNVVLIIAAYLFSSAIFMYWGHRRILHTFPKLTEESDNEESVRFGKNLSLLGILGTLVGQLDMILLWHFGGPTQVAIYAFALATTNPAKTFMKSIVFLAHPKFASQDTQVLHATLGEKIFKSFLFIIPITIIYIALLPYLYQWFFPSYINSVIYAQALGLIFLFFPGKLQGIAIATRIHRRSTYTLNIINPLINGILLLLLIPLFSIWGAVIAIILGYVFSTGITYYYFQKMK